MILCVPNSLLLRPSMTLRLGPSAFPRFASFVFFVWVTGAPLAIMTVLEVCIRVSVQAGPVWRLRSWRRMMIPLFHQLEALALCAMAYRGGMSIYLLFVALGGAVMPTATSDQAGKSHEPWSHGRTHRNPGEIPLQRHEIQVSTLEIIGNRCQISIKI